MHIFKKRLKNKATRVDPNSLVVQRLKRVPAIIKKLNRSYHGHAPSMKLYQMQDIGGCRAVLSNITLARQLCDEYYLKGDLKHPRAKLNDYVQNPKEDGYRSIHLIYKYRSDKRKKEYDNLLIEIQIRSKLQHLWATAIEIVDFFTRQSIKSNEGEKEWADFFRLVSSAFAILENCPLAPNTPQDEKSLFQEIKLRATNLDVINVMKAWTQAINVFKGMSRSNIKNAQFFLLELDIRGSKLNITEYPKSGEQKAIADYAEREKKNKDRKEYDVVLVGADPSIDLKKAYPNYFVDSKDFLTVLEKIIQKYP